MRLKDKVAVVTGGWNGIGSSICLAFACEGTELVVADINVAAANQAMNVCGGAVFH